MAMALFLNGAVNAPITVTSVAVPITIVPTARYFVQADTTCFVAQGSAPTAAVNVGQQVIAAQGIYIDGSAGAVIAVIGTAGRITVTPVAE